MRLRSHGYSIGIFLADMAVVYCSMFLAGWIRWGLENTVRHWQRLFETPFLVFALYIFLFALVGFAHRLYDSHRMSSYGKELTRVVQAWITLGLFTTVMIVALKLEGISRLFIAMFFALQLVGMLFVRSAARWWYMARPQDDSKVEHILVVGDGSLAARVSSDLAAHPRAGQYRLLGYLSVRDGSSDGAGDGTETLTPLKHLGSVDQLEAILHREVVDMVVIALPLEQTSVITKVIQLCEDEGKTVKVVLDLMDASVAKGCIDTFFGMPVLTYHRGVRDNPALLVKAAIDFIGSAVLLLLSAPLMVLIAIAIKLDSKGPVFYKQRRVGLNGREFMLYKFRSMVPNADKMLDQLKDKNEMDGPVFKIRNDPRITRVGRFLRKTSLDELPQLLNVLKGDMSLVGPRPPLPSEVAHYEPWQRRRLSIKPGITCTWQVTGRNDTTFGEWVRMDLEYIDRWNLWLDLKILFKTIPAVFKGTGV